MLGRLVEVLREKPYDACLREHLFAPLGLTHAATSPYEAIMFRAAVGHIEHEPGAGYQPAPVWALARSNAPAGSMLAMRPRDLLALRPDAPGRRQGRRRHPGARARHGRGACTQRQVDLPDLGLMGTSWGLGFERFDTADGAIIGHDGGTIGQSAFLRIVPEAGVAVVLLTNGGDVISLYRDDRRPRRRAAHRRPRLPAPPGAAGRPRQIDASRYVGTYSSEVADLTVSQDDDGRIWLEQTPKGIFEELGEKPERKELVHYQGDSLIPAEPDHGMHMPHAFVGDDGDGHALYLHVGRAVRRAGA